MSQPLRVSIVMPSYNHGRFIREAIESVLTQDYPHIDLLVMDGGSTDDTVSILQSYGDRITFVSEKDRGQSDAINRGLKRVTGDILCWLNSDDEFTPGAVSTVARLFQENPGVEFVYGNGWATREDGTMIGDSGVLPFDAWKLIHQRNFIQQPSCFFKKSLIDKVGGIDESLHYVMDWELWIRFSAFRGLFTREFLSCNRTYDQNKTQSGHFKRWAEIKRVVRTYTTVPWPPILTNYLVEIIIQILVQKHIPKLSLAPLYIMFERGMRLEMSGRYSDGSVERRFRFTAGARGEKQVTLRMVPLSATVPARLNGPPVKVSWKSGSGDKGGFTLLENGLPQEFSLPLGKDVGGFVHFECKADGESHFMKGEAGLPARRIVAFLESTGTAGDLV